MRQIAIDPNIKELAIVGIAPDGTHMLMRTPAHARNVRNIFSVLRRAFGIREVLYEDCYLSVNAKTYARMYHVRELVREACEEEGIQFIPVMPTSWQPVLKIVGKGKPKRNALKAAAQTYALQLLKHEVTPDLADAVCLLHAARLGVFEVENGVVKERKRKRRK